MLASGRRLDALVGPAGSGKTATLAVTERFIRKLTADGDLRAVTIGARVVRFRRTDLKDLLRPARVIPRLRRRQPHR